MRSTIVVCPTADLARTVHGRRPSHVLGFASPGRPLPPAEDTGAQSLALVFNDIAEERPGLVAPDREAMAALLAFAAGWDGSRPIVIHCEMGISRSTAAALAVACGHLPEGSEQDAAERMRAAAPCATPNRLMIRLADELLGREGRLVSAALAIGRGAEFTSPAAFEFALGPITGAA